MVVALSLRKPYSRMIEREHTETRVVPQECIFFYPLVELSWLQKDKETASELAPMSWPRLKITVLPPFFGALQ